MLASAAVKVKVLGPTPAVLGITIAVSKSPTASVVVTFVANIVAPSFNVTVTDEVGTQPPPEIGTDCPIVALGVVTDNVGTVTVNEVVPSSEEVSVNLTVFFPIVASDGIARLIPGTSPEDVRLATV